MEKPTVKLTGQDGNVFNLMGLASRALKRAGQADNARIMMDRIKKCGNYDRALAIIMEYCEVE